MTADVSALAAGDDFTCAITTAGAAKCWGRNAYSQLGNGYAGNSSAPVSVSGLTEGVAKVTTGTKHTCAILTNDTVKCWGGNEFGQLGDGSTESAHTPKSVIGY